MPSTTEITAAQLARLIGLPNAPILIDVRTDEDYAADPRRVPGSIRRAHHSVADWGGDFTGQSVVVICQKGQKLAQGTAAWLRHQGATAETLEGGFLGWRDSGQLLVDPRPLPLLCFWRCSFSSLAQITVPATRIRPNSCGTIAP